MWNGASMISVHYTSEMARRINFGDGARINIIGGSIEESGMFSGRKNKPQDAKAFPAKASIPSDTMLP